MSDPVSNSEVEDVLSSIRRLVSEDKRPTPMAKSDPASDRLVLSPALRVEVSNTDVPTPEPEADRFDVNHVLVDDDTFEISDEGRVKPAAGVLKTPDNTAIEHDYSQDHYNFDAADADLSDHKLDLNTVSSGLDDLVGDPLSAEDQRDLEAALGDAARVDDAAPAPKAATQKGTPAETLSAKIEALETVIGAISDTWEPDGQGGDDYAGTRAPAMAWADDETPAGADDVAAKSQSSVTDQAHRFEREVTSETPQAAPSAPTGLTVDEQLIDEDSLRDLVSEIVRQELQGALGERITRNVRKLVRREIHRALTTQELE